MEVAVTVNAECAHRDAHGRIHGHSYLIEVWFAEGRELPDLYDDVRGIVGAIDHNMLEEIVGGPRMEDVARWCAERLPAATRIVVRRPTLGFSVEWRRDK